MNNLINVGGQLLDLSTPQVMGILNATPDSFYAASRQSTEEAIRERANQIVAEGAAIIDVGACSTRPDSTPASEDEELRRMEQALGIVRSDHPDSIISVDTFRPAVARMAVEQFGAQIINDVNPSSEMFRMVARLGVPYVLTSCEATLRQMLLTFATQVQQLRDFGQKDIIIDPGFGFGKTLDENYAVLNNMERLQVMELPVLAGLSRKSMIYRLLGQTPDEALNGTIVLNTIALMKGAAILRVHDVKVAADSIRLIEKCTAPQQ